MNEKKESFIVFNFSFLIEMYCISTGRIPVASNKLKAYRRDRERLCTICSLTFLSIHRDLFFRNLLSLPKDRKKPTFSLSLSLEIYL